MIAIDLIGDRARLLSGAVLIICVIESLLSFSLLCIMQYSESVLFAQITQLLSWVIVGLLVIVETWRIRNWPWIVVKLYSFLIVLLQTLFASCLRLQEYSNTIVIIAMLHVVLSFLLCFIVILKDLWKSSDDLTKEEMRKISGEFMRNNPIPKHTNSRKNGNIVGFFSSILSLDNGRNHDDESDQQLNLLLDDYLDEFAFNSHNDSRDGKSKYSWRHNNRKLTVESAIERNINSSIHSPSDKHRASSVLSLRQWFPSAFSGSKNNNIYHHKEETDELTTTENEQITLLLTSDDGQRNQSVSNITFSNASFDEKSSAGYSFRSQDSFSSSTGVSRALMQVMDHHKSKLSAANPILEPRGVSSDKHHIHEDIIGGDKDQCTYQVNVQRWGIRNRNSGGRSNNNIVTASESSPIEEEASESLSSFETEFEININVKSQQGVIDQTWTNSESSHLSKNFKWTVWRTAAELRKLHSQMV